MSESWPGSRESVEMVTELNVPIGMRDGVITRADVYRPKSAGIYPVALERTPYDKSHTQVSHLGLRPIRAVSRGYAVVIQDVRGRYASDGKFYPLLQELDDGYDSVEWCAAQPWSSGKVCMWGASYVGATQWLAAAAAPPHLSCIVPLITASNYYEEWFYRGGALQLSFAVAWMLDSFASQELLRRGEKEKAERMLDVMDDMYEQAFKFVPLGAIPIFKGNAEYFYDWLNHPEQDEYWERINLENHHSKIGVPALNVGGWYDIFLQGTLNNFVRMRKSGSTERSRREQRLLIGPWMHWGRAPWFNQLVGDINFGHRASNESIDLEGTILDWFDRWTRDEGGNRQGNKKKKKKKKTAARVTIFVMGENVWRDEDEWPLARTRYTDYFLRSGGSANTLDGDGVLGEDAPAKSEPPDRFVYDPLDPAPTVGGALCCDVTHTPAGPYDQTPVEKRKDVLVYSTRPLATEVEVTGPVVVKLYASTSAADTDFTAKLVDAWPCGYAQTLTQGIVRARYRETRKTAKPIHPGRVYEYSIDVWSTSNVFLKGHSIRLEVSSSNFPQFDRNMNTARHPLEESRPVIAVQHVYHDERRPSRIVLPVIPR